MKDLLKIVLSSLIAIVVILGATGNLSLSPKPEVLRDYSVRINIGERGHGSGVIIGKNIILTAAHVVDGKVEDLKVETSSGKKFPVMSVLKFEGTDLAVVKLPFNISEEYADVSCTSPKYGEDIRAIGNPLDMNFTYTEGVVSGPYLSERIKGKLDDLWLSNVTIAPGSSGGPVYNSSGEVIGVVSVLKPMLLGGMYPTISGFSGFTSTNPYCNMMGE